jgi:hypothetical protein
VLGGRGGYGSLSIQQLSTEFGLASQNISKLLEELFDEDGIFATETNVVLLKDGETKQVVEVVNRQVLDLRKQLWDMHYFLDEPQSDSMGQQHQSHSYSMDQMQSTASRLMDSMEQDFISYHCRLSSKEEETTEEEPIKERLARRLFEYIHILYHPDASIVTVCSVHSFSDTTTTPLNLGMGSENLDSCIYSSYLNGDLGTDSDGAVEKVMVVYRTSRLTFDSLKKNEEQREVLRNDQLEVVRREQKQRMDTNEVQTTYKYCPYSILLVMLYTLIALVGMCTGLIDLWTFILPILNADKKG